MNSCKVKYLQICKDRKVLPNDSILHAFNEGSKHHHTNEGNLVLNLSGCNLSVGDCQLLSKCFATDDSIEEYHFTDCLLSEDACKVTLNAFNFNKCVTVLDLKGNNLRSSGAQLVGKLLKRTTTLRELYLEWNTLGMWDDGITAVAEGLALNRSLQVLDLSNNQISHEGGEAIASSLKQNKVLRTLDMRWNNVGVIGGRAFLSALGHNKYLVNLLLAGNNIPSDTIKAISSAMQRNVDYHSIYEEHQSMTRSLKQEIDHLQHEKSLQVSTLVDQLEKEKVLHENMTETTRDRLHQMKSAIDDLKKENRSLRERNETFEADVKKNVQTISELQGDAQKKDAIVKELCAKHKTDCSDLNEKLSMERKLKQQEDMEKDSHIFELQRTIKELKLKVDEYVNECTNVKNTNELIKREHESEKIVIQQKLSREREEIKSDYDSRSKSLTEKVQKYEKEKERFEEEIGRLKSTVMSDKLKYEEDMISQRSRWKQDEMLKSKQYEDRIDLIISTKDEFQSKISKLSIEVSEMHTQCISCQKELENYKRQNEQQQQLLNQRDLEYRNETNRLRLEIDSEKRKNSELKDQIQKIEKINQELNSQLREIKSLKDAEVARLEGAIKLKDDDIKRIREEELRRAGMLESALQNYILSARSGYK